MCLESVTPFLYLNFRLLLEKMVSVIDHQADDKQAVVIEKVGTGATDVGKVQKPETEEEKEEEREKEPEVPQGSITEAKSLYRKKDSEGKFQWVVDEPQDAVDAAETKETARFAFLVRKKKSYDSRKKYDIDSIIVQSPWLKKSLGTVLTGYPGITTNLERLVFQAPFHPFVHRWAIFASLLEKDDFEDPVAKEHLQLFHDVIYEELKNAIAAKIDLVKNGVITFDHLWTIYEPQTLVYSVSSGKESVFKLEYTQRCTDSRREWSSSSSTLTLVIGMDRNLAWITKAWKTTSSREPPLSPVCRHIRSNSILRRKPSFNG